MFDLRLLALQSTDAGDGVHDRRAERAPLPGIGPSAPLAPQRPAHRAHVEDQLTHQLFACLWPSSFDGAVALDHMTILYGAGISNSTRHSGQSLPLMLVGGGAGRLRGGRHLTYTDKPTIANLLLTLMDKFDVPVERLGASTGKLNIDTLAGL
jgi:hypothetical protein